MSNRFPDLADPWRYCDQGKTIEGKIALASFPRLAPLLVSDEGEADFLLVFGRGEDNKPLITSEVKSTLTIVCQRCLGGMELRVEERSSMVPVSGSLQAEQLPPELDPLLLEPGSMLSIRDLIEDELLLAIPAAPRHKPDECPVDLRSVCGEPPEGQEQSRPDNPFAALAALKNSNSDN